MVITKHKCKVQKVAVMSKMQNVFLAPEDEKDDLYSGYEYSDHTIEGLEDDQEFQRIVRTTYGNRPTVQTMGGQLAPVTAMRRLPGTAAFRSVVGRPGTGIAPESGQARPMTGVTAAGFTSNRGMAFDPMNQAVGKAPAPPLESKPEDSPEERIKKLEKTVNTLIEDSVYANTFGDFKAAMDKAKEAARKERMLCKQREQMQNPSEINLDLTYCVLFNLAIQYHANGMLTEALNTYLLIVRNKLFNNGGHLRVNMGNIYVEQKKYPQAIKMYRMALDQVHDTHKSIRLKILQNIGSVFVSMGQYTDAITSFEHIMNEKANFKTALNLVLCYYALSDQDKLKKVFKQMLQISSGLEDEDRYYPTIDDDPHQRLVVEAIKDDKLRAIEKEEKTVAEYSILTAAKLIALVVEPNFSIGFDWCIETVRSSPYAELASELEMSKAITFLKKRDIPKAIQTFKECGKKDRKMAGSAAINLSFVYFLEGDIAQANKHAETAMEHDKYNPHALVNKGNCLFTQNQFDQAREFYQEALTTEATCTEALYNLGLALKRTGRYPEALECFHKLHSILRNSPEVIYQLADLYDKIDDFAQSIDWFMQLISLVPTDPAVLQRLGEIYESEDQSQALHYYYESYRYSPTNINVISWIGAYYMESQFCDKAVHYFEKASLIQPNQINWQLMVASCYRKMGSYHQALQCYKQIHKRFPDSVDCLKFLVRLCTDLGLKDAQEYSLKLKKAEKIKKQRELSSGSRRSSGSSGLGQGRGRAEQKGGLSAGSDAPSVDSGVGGAAATQRREVDASYVDPLGELPERPRTAARQQRPPVEEDDFQDAELGDLLPD